MTLNDRVFGGSGEPCIVRACLLAGLTAPDACSFVRMVLLASDTWWSGCQPPGCQISVSMHVCVGTCTLVWHTSTVLQLLWSD